MNMKKMTDYALIGMRQALAEVETERAKLLKAIERLENGSRFSNVEKSLEKTWHRRKYPKLTRKQLAAMRRNAALARKAQQAKRKEKGVA